MMHESRPSLKFALAIPELASIAGLFCRFDLVESVHDGSLRSLRRRGSVWFGSIPLLVGEVDFAQNQGTQIVWTLLPCVQSASKSHFQKPLVRRGFCILRSANFGLTETVGPPTSLCSGAGSH